MRAKSDLQQAGTADSTRLCRVAAGLTAGVWSLLQYEIALVAWMCSTFGAIEERSKHAERKLLKGAYGAS